jgi:hypothetical protein
MADLKIADVIASTALQQGSRATAKDRGQAAEDPAARTADAAVKVDVGAPTVQPAGSEDQPSVSDEAARLLALGLRQRLEADNVSVTNDAEASILGLFGKAR